MAIEKIVRVPRGAHANLPTSGIEPGLPYFATDRQTLHIGLDANTLVPVLPDIMAVSAVDAPALTDSILLWDASASGLRRATVDSIVALAGGGDVIPRLFPGDTASMAVGELCRMEANNKPGLIVKGAQATSIVETVGSRVTYRERYADPQVYNGSAVSVNPDNGNAQIITTVGACTIDFAAPSFASPHVYSLFLEIQSAPGATISLPTGSDYLWLNDGGNPPPWATDAGSTFVNYVFVFCNGNTKFLFGVPG